MGVTKCCFCVDLRVGVQVLAVVYGVCNFTALVSAITLLITAKLDRVCWAGLIAQVVLGIAFIAAGVLLFIGATIRRRSFVLPWLVVATMSAIHKVVVIIALCIVWPKANVALYITIPVILALLITLALIIYFWYVVYIFYRTLDDDGDQNHLTVASAGLEMTPDRDTGA